VGQTIHGGEVEVVVFSETIQRLRVGGFGG
jgi:hypothetical protein